MIEEGGEEVDSFTFYLKFAKPLVINLPDPAERALAAAWVKKLKDETSGTENVRKEYLKLLLFVLHRRHLIGPFLEDPSKQNLIDLTQDLNILDYAKQIILKEAADRKSRIQRGLGAGGDYPPYSVECSSDLLEYAAAQDIPKFGVHAYYAISFEPLTKWDNADKAYYPKGAVQDEMEKSLAQAASAPVIGDRPEEVAVSPRRPGSPGRTPGTPAQPELSELPELSMSAVPSVSISPPIGLSPAAPPGTPGTPAQPELSMSAVPSVSISPPIGLSPAAPPTTPKVTIATPPQQITPKQKTPSPALGAKAVTPKVSPKKSPAKKPRPETPQSPFGSLLPPEDERSPVTWASNLIDVAEPEDEDFFSTQQLPDLSLDIGDTSILSGLEKLDSSYSFGGDTTADEPSDVSVSVSTPSSRTSRHPDLSGSTSGGEDSAYYDAPISQQRHPDEIYGPPQPADYMNLSFPFRSPQQAPPRSPGLTAGEAAAAAQMSVLFDESQSRRSPRPQPRQPHPDEIYGPPQPADYMNLSFPFRSPQQAPPFDESQSRRSPRQQPRQPHPDEIYGPPKPWDYADLSLPYTTPQRPTPRTPGLTAGEAAAAAQMASLFSPGEARAKSPVDAAADVHITKSLDPEAQEIIDEAMQSMHERTEPQESEWAERMNIRYPDRRPDMPETPPPLKKYVSGKISPELTTHYEPEQFGLTGEEDWQAGAGFDFDNLPDMSPSGPRRTQWQPTTVPMETLFPGVQPDEYAEGFFDIEAPHVLSDEDLDVQVPEEDVDTRLTRLMKEITTDAKQTTPAASGVATTTPALALTPTRLQTYSDFPIFEQEQPEYESPKLSPRTEAKDIEQRAKDQYKALYGTPTASPKPATPRTPSPRTPSPRRDPNVDEFGMPLIKIPQSPKTPTPKAPSPKPKSPQPGTSRESPRKQPSPGRTAPVDSEEAETADKEAVVSTEPKSSKKVKSVAEVQAITNQQMADLYVQLIADDQEPKTPERHAPPRSGGSGPKKLDFAPHIAAHVTRAERNLGEDFPIPPAPIPDTLFGMESDVPYYSGQLSALDTDVPQTLQSPMRPPVQIPGWESPTSPVTETDVEEPFYLQYHVPPGTTGIMEDAIPMDVVLELDSREPEPIPAGPQPFTYEQYADPFEREDQPVYLDDDVGQVLATHEPVPYKEKLRVKVGKKTVPTSRGHMRPPPVDFGTISEEQEYHYFSPPEKGWAKKLPTFDREVQFSPPSTLGQTPPRAPQRLLNQAEQYFVGEFEEPGQQDMMRRVLHLVGDVEQEPLFADQEGLLQDAAAALPQADLEQFYIGSPPKDFADWDQYEALVSPPKPPTPKPPTPQAAPPQPAAAAPSLGAIPKSRLPGASRLPKGPSRLPKGPSRGPPSKTQIKGPPPGAPARGGPSRLPSKGSIGKRVPSKGAIPKGASTRVQGPPPKPVTPPPPKLATPPPRLPSPPRLPTPPQRMPSPPPPPLFEQLPEFTFEAPVEHFLPKYKHYELPTRPRKGPATPPQLPDISRYRIKTPPAFSEAELFEPSPDVWDTDVPEIDFEEGPFSRGGPPREYHPNELYGPPQAHDYMNLSFPYATPPPRPRPADAEQAAAAQLAMLFPDRQPPQVHPNLIYGPPQAQDYMDLSFPYASPPGPPVDYYSPVQHYDSRQRGVGIEGRPSRSRLRRRQVTKRKIDFGQPEFAPETEALLAKVESRVGDVEIPLEYPDELMGHAEVTGHGQYAAAGGAAARYGGIYYPPEPTPLDTSIPKIQQQSPMQLTQYDLAGWQTPPTPEHLRVPTRQNDDPFYLHLQQAPGATGLFEEAMPMQVVMEPQASQVSALPEDYEPLATEMPFMPSPSSRIVTKSKTTKTGTDMETCTSTTEMRFTSPPRPIGSPQRAPPKSGVRTQSPSRGTPEAALSSPQRFRRPPDQAPPEIADLRHVSPTRPRGDILSKTQSPLRGTPLQRTAPGAATARSLSPGHRLPTPQAATRVTAGEAAAAAQLASLHFPSPPQQPAPSQSGMSLIREETTTTSADGTTTKTTKVTQISPHRPGTPGRSPRLGGPRTPEAFDGAGMIDLGAEAPPVGYMSPPTPGSPASPLSRDDTMREMIRRTKAAPGTVVRAAPRPVLRAALPSMVELQEVRDEPHDTYSYWPGRYDPTEGYGEVVAPSPTRLDMDFDEDYVLPSDRLAAPQVERPRVERQQIYKRVEEIVEDVEVPEDQQAPMSPPVQFIYESPERRSPRTPGGPAFDIETEGLPEYESPVAPVRPVSPYQTQPSPYLHHTPPGYPQRSPYIVTHTPPGAPPPPPLRTPPIFAAPVSPQDMLAQQDFMYESPATPPQPQQGQPGYYSPAEDAAMAAFMFGLEAHEYTVHRQDKERAHMRQWVRSGAREVDLGQVEPDLERIIEIEEPEDTGYRRTPIYVREEQIIEIDEGDYEEDDLIGAPLGAPIGFEYQYEGTQQGPQEGVQQILQRYDRPSPYYAPPRNIMDEPRPVHQLLELPPGLADQVYRIEEDEPFAGVDYTGVGSFDPHAYQRQLERQNQMQPLPQVFQQEGDILEEDYALPEEAGFEVEAPQQIAAEPDIMQQALQLQQRSIQARGSPYRSQKTTTTQPEGTRTETVVTQIIPGSQGRPPQHIESREVVVESNEPPTEQNLNQEVGVWEDYFQPTQDDYVPYEPNWQNMPSPPRPPPRRLTFSDFPEAPQRRVPYKPPRPVTPAKPKKKVKRIIPELSPPAPPRVTSPPPRMPSPRQASPIRQASPRQQQPLLDRMEQLICDVPLPETSAPRSPPMQVEYYPSPPRRQPPTSPRMQQMPVGVSPRAQQSPGVAGYVSPQRRVVTETISEEYFYEPYVEEAIMEGDYGNILDTSDIPGDENYEGSEGFTWMQ